VVEGGSIPFWLILFVIAGFLLFCSKIAGSAQETERWPKLRLFLLLAALLVALAGIADFVIWVNGS
jgi:hypothetical protein